MRDAESFYLLTPERVISSAEAAGFAPTGHCLTLNSLENRVYDLKLEDESHIVVKFYRPGRWSRDLIAEEHRFLFELQEHDVPVCPPLRFRDGESLHEIQGMFFAVWPRTGGRAPDELSDQDCLALGRLLARLHNVGESRTTRRPRLDADRYIRKPLERLLGEDLIPRRFRDLYVKIAERAAEDYDRLSDGIPLHRIHADCHKGNLLRGPDGFRLLDFDDFLEGPAVQDLWLLLPAPGDPDYARQTNLLLEGYRQFREFQDAWLDLAEPLRALRYVRYAGWVARRREDPAFQAAFPDFGTDEYWEAETRDLEEQLSLFDGSRDFFMGGENKAEESEELTNKDFFWDWED